VPKGELAYFIFNQFVKQKYSSEALAAFRDWCINEKKVIRLFMKIAPDNLPSIKVAENCNFECEGLLKGDYRKQEKFLTDMKIYGFTNPYVLKRTAAGDNDFFSLVEKLDNDLRDRYKAKQDFFDQFNGLKSIKNVVVVYENDIPVGCGSIKAYGDHTVELKRMYVLPEKRGRGIAKKIIAELEKWAKELQYNNCILETGILQPEAVKLYKNCGYIIIDNFGQYTNVKESICMKKELNGLPNT
jgi:putative acetyltransferase